MELQRNPLKEDPRKPSSARAFAASGRTSTVKGTLALVALCLGITSPSRAATYYVSPEGNDANAGTLSAPWKTITRARDEIRNTKGVMTEDITVFLRGGTYQLPATVEFDDRDSATGGRNIWYRNYPGERPILSGGRKVTNWTPSGQIWSAPLSIDNKVRDLWVNGKRKAMARADNLLQGLGSYGWFNGAPDGILIDAASIPSIRNPQDLELNRAKVWTYHILCVEDVLTDPAYQGKKILKMQQPYWSFAQTQSYNANSCTPTSGYQICNALEFLDRPGEFYFDRSSGILSYMPEPGEDMATVEVIAPETEVLLRVRGRSMAQKAHNLRFWGLVFAYDSWQLDRVGESFGASCVQGPKLSHLRGSSASSEGDTIIQAAVDVSAAEDVTFERNTFEHCGGGGINLVNGVNRATIQGNIFRDLGSSAVIVAHPDLKDLTVLTQFPEEEPCVGNIVRNNLIREVCTEFLAGAAIHGFFPTALEVSHNDILGTPYSGISIGWVWNNTTVTPASENVVTANRIVNSLTTLWDGGAIYTLGRQLNTYIAENFISGSVSYGAIYPDEGSSYFRGVVNNVCEIDNGVPFVFIHVSTVRNFGVSDTWTTSSAFRNSGAGVSISNTHLYNPTSRPAAAQAIIDRSGLELPYQDLFASTYIAPTPIGGVAPGDPPPISGGDTLPPDNDPPAGETPPPDSNPPLTGGGSTPPGDGSGVLLFESFSGSPQPFTLGARLTVSQGALRYAGSNATSGAARTTNALTNVSAFSGAASKAFSFAGDLTAGDLSFRGTSATRIFKTGLRLLDDGKGSAYEAWFDHFGQKLVLVRNGVVVAYRNFAERLQPGATYRLAVGGTYTGSSLALSFTATRTGTSITQKVDFTDPQPLAGKAFGVSFSELCAAGSSVVSYDNLKLTVTSTSSAVPDPTPPTETGVSTPPPSDPTDPASQFVADFSAGSQPFFLGARLAVSNEELVYTGSNVTSAAPRQTDAIVQLTGFGDASNGQFEVSMDVKPRKLEFRSTSDTRVLMLGLRVMKDASARAYDAWLDHLGKRLLILRNGSIVASAAFPERLLEGATYHLTLGGQYVGSQLVLHFSVRRVGATFNATATYTDKQRLSGTDYGFSVNERSAADTTKIALDNFTAK